MTAPYQRACVIGLGKSGKGAISLLRQHGVAVSAFDEKPDNPEGRALEAPGVSVRLGPLPEKFWEGSDVVVVSPGVPLSKPELVAAKAAGANLIGEVQLAFDFLPEGAGPVLGITGTNGKSTTTALLGELVAQSGKKTFVGGNLGRPFTEACSSKHELHVVEFSSFQLEGLTTAGMLGAAILNLTPDHLDRYASHEAYGEAKSRIFRNQPKNGFGVVNADDHQSIALSRHARVPMYAFTREPTRTNFYFKGLCVGEGDGFGFFFFGEKTSFTVRNRALRGGHNLENAMAAALMAHLSGIDAAAIQRGLDSFPGLPHRLEFVRELNGVEWINDSKATNVDSTLVALKAIPGRIWLIAGGKGKGAPYAPLVDVSKGKLAGVLTIGKDAPAISEAFVKSTDVYSCETIDRAVEKAKSLAKRGDTVLLSPACASYDQFQHFEHRGDTFKSLVRAL